MGEAFYEHLSNKRSLEKVKFSSEPFLGFFIFLLSGDLIFVQIFICDRGVFAELSTKRRNSQPNDFVSSPHFYKVEFRERWRKGSNSSTPMRRNGWRDFPRMSPSLQFRAHQTIGHRRSSRCMWRIKCSKSLVAPRKLSI